MVYSLIDDAHTDGIWSRTIKIKTAMNDAVFRAALKSLETKRLISDMKSVENPTRKMYIKSTLRPSEKATGGAWYTDNELDEAFIDGLTSVLYKYIEARSFYRSTHSAPRRRPAKRIVGMSAAAATAARDTALKAQPRVKSEHSPEPAGERITLLPLPPTYRGYPSLGELTLFIESSPITSTTLTPDDIAALLDVLVYDRRVERIVAGPDGVAFRAVRRAIVGEEAVERGNGITEAPCGRCPVFELCEEGGPVCPSTCVYFQEWLGGGF